MAVAWPCSAERRYFHWLGEAEQRTDKSDDPGDGGNGVTDLSDLMLKDRITELKVIRDQAVLT
jgi:hypothetical protein